MSKIISVVTRKEFNIINTDSGFNSISPLKSSQRTAGYKTAVTFEFF